MKNTLWVLVAGLLWALACGVTNGSQTLTLAGEEPAVETEATTESQASAMSLKEVDGVYAKCAFKLSKQVVNETVDVGAAESFVISITLSKEKQYQEVCRALLKQMEKEKKGIPIVDTLISALDFASAESSGELLTCKLQSNPAASDSCSINGSLLNWNPIPKELGVAAILKVETKVKEGCKSTSVAGLAEYLGDMSKFNVFTFGDMSVSNSDIEGFAFGGGYVTAKSYSFGLARATEEGVQSNELALVSGRILNATDVEVWGGNVGVAQCGDPAHFENCYKTSGFTIMDGTIPLPVSVTQENFWSFWYKSSNLARALSDRLMKNMETSSSMVKCEQKNSSLVCDGVGKGSLVYFQIKAEDMTKLWSLDVKADDNATMVFNVVADSSGSLEFHGGLNVIDSDGIQLQGDDRRDAASRMIWNVKGIQTLSIYATGLLGTVLATEAAVVANAAVMEGQLFASSLEGYGQFNWVPFEGELGDCGNTASVVELDAAGNTNVIAEATVTFIVKQ